MSTPAQFHIAEMDCPLPGADVPECDLCRNLDADLDRMVRDREEAQQRMEVRQSAASRYEWEMLRQELNLAQTDVQLISELREEHRRTHRSAN